MNENVAWITLALLGAYHGLNPAMGWLFAVALGLQERSRRAVIRAFSPIALGHALAIAVTVALVGVARTVISPGALQLAGAGLLVSFGLYKLLAPMAHPRWVGMRVNFRDLTAWSFLMSSAHGAGLMIVPVLLQLPQAAHAHHAHASHVEPAMARSASLLPLTDLAALMVHTGAMFLVMAAIALLVYEKLGLAILRRAWLNVDRLWAGALIGAGVLTLIL